MVVHDEQIGMMLDKLDELGIADNTIVMYSTDNGPENDTWPDGANTPFRGQKDSNWEGGWRVPSFIRWPGQIKPGSVFNGIVSHIDMFPTLLAIAGNPDVTEQLLAGTHGRRPDLQRPSRRLQHGSRTSRAKSAESPRQAIIYFSDDGDVIAVRIGDYKFHLAEQRANQMRQWAEPFVKLRLPYIMNLRRDPFERAEYNSNTYLDWMVDHVPQLYEMQAVVAEQIADFAKFPPDRSPPRSTWTPCWRRSRSLTEASSRSIYPRMTAPLTPTHATERMRGVVLWETRAKRGRYGSRVAGCRDSPPLTLGGLQLLLDDVGVGAMARPRSNRRGIEIAQSEEYLVGSKGGARIHRWHSPAEVSSSTIRVRVADQGEPTCNPGVRQSSSAHTRRSRRGPRLGLR